MRARPPSTPRREVLESTAALGLLGLAGCSSAGDGDTDRPLGYAPLGRVPIEGAAEAVVGPNGTTVYIAAQNGFAIADVSDPSQPTVIAERRDLLTDRFGRPMGGIQDVAVDGDWLLVVGPAHTDHDLPDAALLYDVSVPQTPDLVAVHETDFPIHNADLADGLAYLTATDGSENPLVIVDMFAESGPAEIGRWSVIDADTDWWSVPGSMRPIHDVTVHGDRAVLAYWDAGTWLLDVEDPTTPVSIAHVADQSIESMADLAGDAVDVAGSELPGNSHFALLNASGTLLGVGREAWDADRDGVGGPGGIDLYAVDDDSPTHRGTIAPPPTPDPSIEGPWTTAHNFGFSGTRLYASWYRGGVSVHDVANPTAPATLAAWRQPRTAAFWTARPAEHCFVATSTDILRGTDGAIFTFPDSPGRQSDPPPIELPPTTAQDG